jgi:hypothetical protein
MNKLKYKDRLYSISYAVVDDPQYQNWFTVQYEANKNEEYRNGYNKLIRQ